MIVFASEGVIVGGWEYVWASFIMTWVVLAGYGVSLWWRTQKENR